MGTVLRDRTSELPKDLLQHILSFLPVKDAVCASIVSKVWLQAWYSRPNLIFDEFSFLWGKLRFKKFFVRTLNRCRLNKHIVSGQDMTVMLDMLNDTELASALCLCVKVAMIIHVKHLHLSIENFDEALIKGMMPMLVEVEPLISLCIKGRLKMCELANSERSMPHIVCGNVTIKCTSLRSLTLCHVELDENDFHNLLFRCRLIEILVLEGCTGLKRIRVEKTCTHLKQLEISTLKSEMGEVNIKAPSLESFIYKVLTKRVLLDSVLRVKLAAPKLKLLELSEANITNENLEELLLTSPVLEDLTLKHCNKLERMYVSSLSLRRFSQLSCLHLLEVELNAPSLVSYKCFGIGSIPSITFCEGTIPMEARIEIVVSNCNATSLLIKLRDFVSKVKNSWISVITNKYNVDLNLENLRAYPIPVGHQVKQLSLYNLSLMSSIFEDIVEGLLWACQPKQFVVRSRLYGDLEGVHFLVQKLLMAKRKDLSCCCKDGDDQIKCRRHYFTDLRVESFDCSYSYPCCTGTYKFAEVHYL